MSQLPRTPDNHTTPGRKRGPVRPKRRGDDIPSVSEYSHWNEEAEAIWYLENRYDMEHADEPLDDPDVDDFFDEEDE